MPLVRYAGLDENRECHADPGESLLALSLRHGLRHAHECNGLARCTTCRVRVLSDLAPVAGREPAEQEIATACRWTDDIRLACQTPVIADMVVERLVAQPGAGPRGFSLDQSDGSARECEMVLLFTDIAGFSNFAAGHLPYDTVHLLNRFYLAAGQPILDHGGTIDNYIGDGMLALFEVKESAEETCRRALRAALAIRRRVTEVKDFARLHLDFDFANRIGLHRGPVVVGRIGHPDFHRTTVIGNAVNIASRIESANKLFGTDLLASEDFVKHIRGDLVLTPHPATQLPGFPEPFDLFEIAAFADFSPALELEHSLARLVEEAPRFCDVFYEDLFASDGRLRAFFKSTDMPRLKAKLLETLQLIVATARKPEALKSRLLELGRLHQSLGVKTHHYPKAQVALQRALRIVRGEELTAAEELTWAQTLSAVVAVMSQA
jgi:adenylate cyclase